MRRRCGGSTTATRNGARRAVAAGLDAVADLQALMGATELQVLAAGHGGALGELGLRLAVADGDPWAVLRLVDQWRSASLDLGRHPPGDPVLAADLAARRAAVMRLEAAAADGTDPALARRAVGDLEARIRARTRHLQGAARAPREVVEARGAARRSRRGSAPGALRARGSPRRGLGPRRPGRAAPAPEAGPAGVRGADRGGAVRAPPPHPGRRSGGGPVGGRGLARRRHGASRRRSRRPVRGLRGEPGGDLPDPAAPRAAVVGPAVVRRATRVGRPVAAAAGGRADAGRWGGAEGWCSRPDRAWAER